MILIDVIQSDLLINIQSGLQMSNHGEEDHGTTSYFDPGKEIDVPQPCFFLLYIND